MEGSGGDVLAYEQHHTDHRGIGGWSRTRWIVAAAVLVALFVGVVIALAYSGGGGGGSY
jgi:hypothetical protein